MKQALRGVARIGLLAILAVPLSGQDVLRNARIVERAATIEDAVGGALKDTMGPTWITWSVPQSGGRSFCCCDGPGRRESPCTLEEDHDFGSSSDDRASLPPTVMHPAEIRSSRRLRPRMAREPEPGAPGPIQAAPLHGGLDALRSLAGVRRTKRDCEDRSTRA